MDEQVYRSIRVKVANKLAVKPKTINHETIVPGPIAFEVVTKIAAKFGFAQFNGQMGREITYHEIIALLRHAESQARVGLKSFYCSSRL